MIERDDMISKREKQKPIRFCCIAPKGYPLFNPAVREHFGGAPVDLYFLATELAKSSEFEVSYIVADYGQPEVERLEKVSVIKSFKFSEGPLKTVWGLWRALKRANADIYMFKTASAGAFLIALFCRLNSRAFVYRMAHRDECDGTYLREHGWSGRLFKWALRRARLVFAQNQEDVDCLKETVGVEGIVIANGHRIGSLETAKRQSILWVGRSVAFKRAKLFLRLARTFGDEQFVMVCQPATGDGQFESLQTQAAAMANVEFLDYVAFDQIDEYYSRAKVLVNTSEAEGFPNTFIQAARCGTTILSLKVNPDNFLNRHQCGLCAQEDWDCFIQMFERLRDSAVAESYGQNGRDYVKQHHDIQTIAKRYADIFKEIL